MITSDTFEIFLVCPPGLEDLLCAEAQEKGFAAAQAQPGGVAVQGGWPEVWRANLELRGAARVLARIGGFMAFHLAQLDKRSRKFPFGEVLRSDVPVKVQVTSKASKIYHAGAAAQRIETALRESHGITVDAEAALVLKVRIYDNQVTFSLDTSGEALHKRGPQEAVGKAPMPENRATLEGPPRRPWAGGGGQVVLARAGGPGLARPKSSAAVRIRLNMTGSLVT